MTMNNSTYWVKRAAKRMIEYQSEADAVADEVAKAYVRATKAINAEMYKIFNTFTFESGLSESEVRDLLNKKASRKTLNKFKAALETVEEPKERREMINAINAPAYAHRIGRFETLQKNIDVQTANLATFEENVTKRHYVDLADEAYNRCVFDIQKGTGLNFSFAKMPVSKVSEILNNKWSGQLFSERIWGKTDEINKVLKEELLVGFMTGRGYKKTAKEIEGRMAVGAMEARRLVRTESAYVSSMAEMESYKELGVDKYKFVATLDMRTSAVCQSLDGKKFKISEGVPGVNMPPMHPWCRSTTVPAIDSSAEKGLTRRAKDPVTGKAQKVPANMTYEKWRKSLDNTYGAGTWETERKKLLNEKSDKQQYRSYKSVLGKENVPETFDKFREMKYNNSENYRFMRIDYLRQNKLRTNPELVLPNANSASADDRKFTEYLFNPQNKRGYAKGAIITSRLGYDANNYDELKSILLERANKYVAIDKGTDQYGTSYEQKIIVYGLKGKPANVIVAWKVCEKKTHLTSAYIKEIE